MPQVKNILFVFILLSIAGSCQQNSNTNTAPVSQALDTGFAFRKLTNQELQYYNAAAEDYYQRKLKNTGFNGSILVAKNGQIIFEDYKGYINFKTKDSISASTPFHLASTSKTFTGMTLLRLWEQGKLSLDDPLDKFFPHFPYQGITVRMLLCHRSGLPNYLDFLSGASHRRVIHKKGKKKLIVEDATNDHLPKFNTKEKLTNTDVLNFMIKYHPNELASPNRIFHYNNTNFLLLALIIEKITNMSFPEYMKDSVFTPLGLQNSFVFSIKDTAQYIPTYSGNRPWPMDNLDCTYGDKNIYCSTHDLFMWDKALYQHSFIKQSTEDLAFTPTSHERKSMHNYGLAWHLFYNNNDTLVYHNGKWHGTNTVFARVIKDTATIIVLGNKTNRNIYAAKNLAAIFTGKPDESKLEE